MALASNLANKLLTGLSVVGPMCPSSRWPPLTCERPWTICVEGFQGYFLHCADAGDSEHQQEDFAVGPFFEPGEVSRLVGSPCWVPTQRFEVVQRSKIRGVDSATANGINFASLAPRSGLRCYWVLDECKAYRQIALRPERRRYSVVSMKEPDSGRQAYFVMIGISRCVQLQSPQCCHH